MLAHVQRRFVSKVKKLINITDKHLVSLGIDKRLLIMTDRKHKNKIIHVGRVGRGSGLRKTTLNYFRIKQIKLEDVWVEQRGEGPHM